MKIGNNEKLYKIVNKSIKKVFYEIIFYIECSNCLVAKIKSALDRKKEYKKGAVKKLKSF